MTETNLVVLRAHLPLLPDFVAPQTSTEQKLAAIWRRALTMDRVGITDRFDDLGIDSLLAASIFAQIESTFGIQIPMATLIDAPTIKLLGLLVDKKLNAATE